MKGGARAAAGAAAERQAVRFLKRQGLAVLATNYRCRLGEIDIIARDGETLVFVEVRLRRHGAFGGAAASVDPRKQRRLAAAAAHYLQHAFGAFPPPCRFDVLAWDGACADRSPALQWLKDAFRLDD
ncbi:MAG: UPF0102 protein [Porticoccaceae bacterium]|nr:MAG: UPF0102 protein [Porticoccaceae bacterium]